MVKNHVVHAYPRFSKLIDDRGKALPAGHDAIAESVECDPLAFILLQFRKSELGPVLSEFYGRRGIHGASPVHIVRHSCRIGSPGKPGAK